MKYDIKPNQSVIRNGPKVTIKEIRVIIINIHEKRVYELFCQNSLSEIKKVIDIYSHKEIPYNNELDVLYIGIDKDVKENETYFKLKGRDEKYFQNGVLVKLPKSGDYEKLQRTKVEVHEIERIVEFSIK